jgi:hypothetical protein
MSSGNAASFAPPQPPSLLPLIFCRPKILASLQRSAASLIRAEEEEEEEEEEVEERLFRSVEYSALVPLSHDHGAK